MGRARLLERRARVRYATRALLAQRAETFGPCQLAATPAERRQSLLSCRHRVYSRACHRLLPVNVVPADRFPGVFAAKKPGCARPRTRA